MGYAELHCLSNFSFLRGASHPEELVERAAELGYAALAITDECSVAGVVRAHVAARERGLKLIVGSEFRLDDGLRCVLLATDRRGYGQLCRLITRARRAAPKGQYRLEREDFARAKRSGSDQRLADSKNQSGRRSRPLHYRYPLSLTPSWPAWPLAAPARPDPTEAAWLAAVFPGRLWIAVELLTTGQDRRRLATLQELGGRLGLPLVAAGDVHMHARGRRALQDVLTATRLGTTVDRAGYALYPERRAPPAAAAAARRTLSPGAARRDARHRRALHASRSTSCATSIRARSCPRARRPRAGCGRLTERGRAATLAAGRARSGGEHSSSTSSR